MLKIKTPDTEPLEKSINRLYDAAQSECVSFMQGYCPDPVLATPAIFVTFITRAAVQRALAFSAGASAVGGAYALGGRWG